MKATAFIDPTEREAQLVGGSTEGPEIMAKIIKLYRYPIKGLSAEPLTIAEFSNSAFRCNRNNVCQYCNAKNGIANLRSGSPMVLLKVLWSRQKGWTTSTNEPTEHEAEVTVSSQATSGPARPPLPF